MVLEKVTDAEMWGNGSIKILLVQTLNYTYASGGASKANRCIMEGLAAMDHDCHVISGGPQVSGEGVQRLRRHLEKLGARVIHADHKRIRMVLARVLIDMVVDYQWLFSLIQRKIATFVPDIVLVSEDPGLSTLQTAVNAGAKRTVYLSHSQATLPFGPASFTPNTEKNKILGMADGIIAVSCYLAGYIEKYGGMSAKAIYSPAYGHAPFPFFGCGKGKKILMINPSKIKGITIFLALARELPDWSFAAVPAWATHREEIRELRDAGVEIIPPSQRIDDIFFKTSILLVPSLWGEAFGQIVVEAMLRGLPVLASNLGGLPEAKQGLDYLIPVREIEDYEALEPGRVWPDPVIPEQDIRPWREALLELLENPDRHRDLARQSRETALAFVESLNPGIYETYFRSL